MDGRLVHNAGKRLDMQSILQLVINGCASGFIYFLVAFEITIIYNSSGLMNFSHENFIILGAYVFGGLFVKMMGFNHIFAVIFTLIFMAVFGAVVALGIFNPLRNLPSNVFAIFGTVLLSKILTELVRITWGAAPFSIPGFLTGYLKFGSLSISNANICIIAMALIFLYLQNLFYFKTKLGKAMRCVNQDKKAAGYMGINVQKCNIITIAMSASVCAVIGMLIVPIYNVDLSMAGNIATKGFIACVVGGFGTIPGAIIGGLFLGILENMYTYFGPAIYKDAVSFIVFIIFLLIRPNGILGKVKITRS